ncbi:Disease resistance protein L6 [Linum grandiflorum]
MSKLVILEMKTVRVEDDSRWWKGIKMARKLKVITLLDSYGLKRTPDLSECGSLELLTFERSSMKGELEIGNLKSLRKLRIVDCGVTKLTGTVMMLTNLEAIEYFGCSGAVLLLSKLPTSLKKLATTSIVPNLSELKDLKELHFKDCRGGVRIPGDIWKLSNLKTLIIECALHDTLATENAPLVLPPSLVFLRVRGVGNHNLPRLPSLANLNTLTDLDLARIRVTEIHGLGALRSLVTLKLYGAPNLNNLEGLENLVLLTDLRVEECPVIERMPNLANLNRLCCLVIAICDLLTEIQGIGELGRSLSHLEITGCPNLAEVEWLQSLSGLERLELEGCDSVEILPSLSKLERLKVLTVKKNRRLRKIWSLDHLNSLQHLDISHCDSLKQVPDLSHLRNVKRIRIEQCHGLTELTVAEGLESLEHICIQFCNSITKLSILSTNLKQLKIEYCKQFSEFIGIEGLESLELFELRNCPSIQKLSGLSGLKSLRQFTLWGCTQLPEVIGLERLESLEGISLTDCGGIMKLSDLSNLKNLKNLHIGGIQLSEVAGLERLDSLEQFSMYGCEVITKLPDLSHLKNLKDLSVAGCPQLAEVIGPSVEGREKHSKVGRVVRSSAKYCKKLTRMVGESLRN